VVTQWPRSARSFWEMTRRFKPADFSFAAPAGSGVDADAVSALDRQRR
jgi:cyclohexanone monooxygenase